MKRRYIVLPLILLLAAGYTLCCAAVDTGRILPKTFVNGRMLGGMRREEAVKILEEEAKVRCAAAVYTVSFAGEHYTVDLQEALEYDADALAEELLSCCRGNFWTRGFVWLQAMAFGTQKKLPFFIKDADTLAHCIELSGLKEAGATTQTTFRIKDGNLVFTKGKSGEDPDMAALAQALKTAVETGETGVVECPVTLGKVQKVDLDQAYEKIHRDPQNATLDPKNNYQIVESVTGVDFDKENARSALDRAKEGSVIEIPLRLAEPEISTKDLKKRLFADKLGTYTTKVNGTPGRLANVSLAAQKCNGAVLLEGEIFSFNDAVGEQSEKTGFYKANAILDGKIVQAYGGGICQVSSTVFAAALYANMEIAERWEHDYVSGYIDAGMDAAVAYGALDLKLGNASGYPVRMDVFYENGYLTADIWGTKTDDSVVEVETETVADSGENLEVQTYRKIYNADKSQVFVQKIAYSAYAH